MDEYSQDIFFPKSGHFFFNFEKGQGTPPPPISSYAPVIVRTQYVVGMGVGKGR